MELRQLEIFQALAAELNFTRAAARVHCVQSNVTTQIRALEAEFGAPLFERLGKTVRLTEAGQRLLPYADQVLRLLKEAQAVAVQGNQPSGKLMAGSPETVVTYRLPRILRRFQERFPRVELIFRPLSSVEIWQQITNGNLDFVFTIGEMVEHPSLVVEYLSPEPMTLIASPKHPLANRNGVRAADLEQETFLLTEHGCAYRRKLEKVLAAEGVVPRSVLEFDSVEAIKQCVALNMGIAVLPRITLSAELERGSLATLTWKGPDLTMATQMAWHKDKWVSPAMAAFLGTVREAGGLTAAASPTRTGS